VTQLSTVFVVDIDWNLLADLNALFAQAMHEGVLVNLFKVSTTEIIMNRKTCASDRVAERQNV